RLIHGAQRGALRDLPWLRGWGVLPLGEAVDLVVEEQDAEVDVAPQRVDQVVAADRQRVAVAGDHPDREIGARDPQPGRNGRRPAMDGGEAVGVDVVWEAARAADARDEHEVLAWHAQLGQELLHLREDRVVPAAGTPADVLIGNEVLAIERNGAHDGTSTA